MATVAEMRQALIRSGVSESNLKGLSEEQLLKMCSDRLRASLLGDGAALSSDNFTMNYNYNLKFPLPGGKEVKVAKVAETTFESGRKIETFIDVAGNQYYQYCAADGTHLDEKYFRRNENIKIGERLNYMNGKMYRQGITSEPQEFGRTEQSSTLMTRGAKKEEDNRTHGRIAVDMLKSSVSGDAEKMLYFKVREALNSKNYAGAVALFGDYLWGGMKDAYKLTNHTLKSAIYDGLMNLGPEQLGNFIDSTFVDDGDDNNVSTAEKIVGVLGSASKEILDIGTSPEMLALPTLIESLPAKAIPWVTSILSSMAGSYVVAEGPGAIADAVNAKTSEENQAAGEKLGDVAFSAIVARGAFGAARKMTQIKGQFADFASQLADIKGPDGKPLLSKSDIQKIVSDVKKEDDKNFQAKVLAVLSNPDEVKLIAQMKGRAAAVWKAVMDPLNSTNNKYPELFKTKAETPKSANYPHIDRSRKGWETHTYSDGTKIEYEFKDDMCVYYKLTSPEGVVTENPYGFDIEPSTGYKIVYRPGGWVNYVDTKAKKCVYATMTDESGTVSSKFENDHYTHTAEYNNGVKIVTQRRDGSRDKYYVSIASPGQPLITVEKIGKIGYKMSVDGKPATHIVDPNTGLIAKPEGIGIADISFGVYAPNGKRVGGMYYNGSQYCTYTTNSQGRANGRKTTDVIEGTVNVLKWEPGSPYGHVTKNVTTDSHGNKTKGPTGYNYY